MIQVTDELATKVFEAQNGADAIVDRIYNPFGDILIFTDAQARDAYGAHSARGFSMVGTVQAVVRHLNDLVEVPWAQLRM